MQLNQLRPGRGANKDRKRRGRGTGSGQGTTGGRGNKGQNARKSGQVRQGFEGGQMPLIRRIPKRGFNNAQFATVYEIVNLAEIEARFEAGETVNAESLKARRLVHCNEDGIKILGDGELTKKLTFEVDKVSKSAEEKIKKAGGDIKLIEKVKYVAKKENKAK